MTATNDTTTATTSDLLMLDPHSLTLDRNVRDTVDTDSPAFAQLVASIREHGVLAALTATRYTDENTILVTDGQRRTLAAREAGTTTVPVMVTTSTDTGKTRQYRRLVTQIETNGRDEDLTDGQLAAGYAEMLDLGISQTRIRKDLQIKPDVLKKSVKVGRSTAARAALDSGQLDLEQAAIVGTFDAQGDTDAVTKLLAAGKWDFRYTANRILADREETRARTVAAQPWIERGHTLLAEEPSADHGWRHLDSLVTDTGEPATITAHVDTDPARWSIWVTCHRDDLITVKDGGHRIESDSVDWSTQDDPAASAAEGLYHCEQVDIADDWTVDYYTTDTDAAALGLRTAAAALAATDGAGPDDPQARAARQAQAEADHKEAARLERRKVKRLNKLGDAAITTRRQWVTEYLTRKTPPRGAAAWVAQRLCLDSTILTDYHARGTAETLLGFDFHTVANVLETVSDQRAQVITLGQVFGGFDSRIQKDSWRGAVRGVADYLHYLQSLGYPLSQIEEVVAGDRTSDDVDDDQ